MGTSSHQNVHHTQNGGHLYLPLFSGKSDQNFGQIGSEKREGKKEKELLSFVRPNVGAHFCIILKNTLCRSSNRLTILTEITGC
jgi:hypothetical protein